MKTANLFINGIYRNVLEEILKTQSGTPDQTLFLQPYSPSSIKMLMNDPPTIDKPVRLYASTTDDLPMVSYAADIIGWEDKTKMDDARREDVDSIIKTFQPGEVEDEEGLWVHSPTTDRPYLNLLSIRRLVKLANPFSVANLVKVSDEKPLSTNRSRAGGWSYVYKVGLWENKSVEEFIGVLETDIANYDGFDPDSSEDARDRTLRSIVQRRGQPEFRRKLLEAYGRHCAVTGCDVEEVLEACHIISYKGPKTNHPTNGLLLRADLHTLFDLGLVAIDAEPGKLLIAEKLQGTYYESLAGATIKFPTSKSLKPNREALDEHRARAGL